MKRILLASMLVILFAIPALALDPIEEAQKRARMENTMMATYDAELKLLAMAMRKYGIDVPVEPVRVNGIDLPGIAFSTPETMKNIKRLAAILAPDAVSSFNILVLYPDGLSGIYCTFDIHTGQTSCGGWGTHQAKFFQ